MTMLLFALGFSFLSGGALKCATNGTTELLFTVNSAFSSLVEVSMTLDIPNAWFPRFNWLCSLLAEKLEGPAEH